MSGPTPEERARALVVVVHRDHDDAVLRVGDGVHAAVVAPPRADVTLAEWRAAIERAITDAVAAEREACARACETGRTMIDERGNACGTWYPSARECAAAIRARGGEGDRG